MSKTNRLHKLADECWYGQSSLSVLFLPLSWLFAAVSAIRRTAYLRDWFERPAASLPVIVVGNLSVGGTGKTPIVAWLAAELRARGYKPGIVSRGYGSAAGAAARLLGPDDTAQSLGDEPVLLATLTGCPVAVGADRVAAVRLLLKEDVDVVIADDGLQHYRMRRDVEIVVIDGARGLGNGRLLPAGPLRESSKRLKSVDAVFVNGSATQVAGIPFELAQTGAINLANGERCELSTFRGQRVWALAGIGNPERFRSALQLHGIETDAVEVADHGRVELADLLAQRRQAILMTQKDAVKYPNNKSESSKSESNHNELLWYVPVTVKLDEADKKRVTDMIVQRITVSAAGKSSGNQAND